MINFKVADTERGRVLQVWATSPDNDVPLLAGAINLDGKFRSNPEVEFVIDDQDLRNIADKCLVTRKFQIVFA